MKHCRQISLIQPQKASISVTPTGTGIELVMTSLIFVSQSVLGIKNAKFGPVVEDPEENADPE